jgi:DNA-binding response OmpR family regulator
MAAKYRIMVVDDEEDIRAVVAQILTKKYEVVQAKDGLDALEKLERAEPDFVVLDVMMPLMDGFKACEAIRKHPHFASVPVLFLSALNTRDNIKKGYESGANLYLTKPFDPQRLLRNVDMFFETQNIPARDKTYTLEDLRKREEEKTAAPPKPAAAIEPAPAIKKIPVPNDTVPGPGRDWESTPPDRDRTAPFVDWGARPRLMIVDDDADLVATVEAGLAAMFEIVKAYDGIEAIEKIVSCEPDIILIDGMMPRMTGYQLCQSLRRNQRYRDAPIMFMSAKSSPNDVTYAKRLGGDEFLAKPFNLNDLRAKLLTLCGKSNFRVCPKRMTIEEIKRLDKRQEAERADREQVQAAKQMGIRTVQRPEGELEKFLREMSGREVSEE